MTPEQHYTAEDRKVAHREKMRNKAARRDRYHAQMSQRIAYDPSKNADPTYRKSIWPKGKVASPARMGA